MHKKAQYIDGKLVDKDGREVEEVIITDLNPPPPPVIEDTEEEHPKRKNITIS